MNLYQQQQQQSEQKVSTSEYLAQKARDIVAEKKEMSTRINGVTGLELSPSEYSMIATAMSTSKDPDATANKFAQALTYSKNTGITFEDAYNNLDALNYAQLGKKVDATQTGTKAVINSFMIGKLTVKRQNAAKKAYMAYKEGQDVESIINSDIGAEIQAIDDEIASLQDYTPRAWYTDILKTSANTLSYSFKVAVAAGVGKVIGVVARSNPVGTGLATLFSFARGYSLTKYGNWYDNVKDGIDPEVADKVQTVSTAIQAAIESYLDINVGLVKSLGTGTAKSIASNTIKNMYVNGTLNKIGLFLTKYGINMASEGMEEFLQEITDEVGENIAYALSRKEAPNEVKDILSNSVQAFIGGASAAIILGLGEAVYETKMDVKYAQKLRQEAIRNPSKETFIKNHIKDERLGETLSRSQKSEILSEAYDKTRKTAQEEGVKLTEASNIDTDYYINDDFIEDPNNPGNDSAKVSEQPVEPIKRMDNGRLRTQESTKTSKNTDGTESHTLNLGSRGSSTRYGYVDYTLDTQNKTVIIDEVRTKKGYENITRDAILEVERSYEGWNIQWNPTTESQQKIKEQLINDTNNPNRGNLQWFNEGQDVDTNIYVGNWIKKTFTNLTDEESIVAAKLLEFIAQAQGTDVKTWINDHIQNLSTFDKKGKKGAVKFDSSDIKAIIYAGKNADFSTFTHETFHVLVRTSQAASQLSQALKNASQTEEFARYVNSHKQIIKMDLDEVIDAIKDMGDDPLQWTRAQHEVAATFFESYLRDGKTFNEKLKNIFTRIADWFHRIYLAIHGENALNEDIVKAYDEILAGNPELKKAVETSQNIETAQNVETAQENKYDASLYENDEDNGLDEFGNPLYQDDNDEYKQTEAILRADSKNFDSEGNHLAPNGQKSNLTYKQWVQVRTESFKNWFGDWENDPQNASKVVDKNGEPLVVYHGSADVNFDVFDMQWAEAHDDRPWYSKTKNPEAAWFSDSREVSDSVYNVDYYHRNTNGIFEVFLNMKNPLMYDAKGKAWHRLEYLESMQKKRNPLAGMEIIKGIFVPEFFEETSTDEIAIFAKNKEYDGVVFNNIIDGEINLNPSTTYAVFNSNQIKSATNNVGTFDANNDSILYQVDPFENKEKNQESIDDFVNELSTHNLNKRYQATDFYKPYVNCPVVLQELGYQNLPLWMRKSKVSKVLETHPDMDIDTIGLAVMSISDPIAVFDSVDNNGKIRKNQLVVVTEVENKNGKKVIVPLHMDEKTANIDVDIIASAYSKDYSKIFDKWASLGALKYLKNNEIGSQLMPLQLRGKGNQSHLQNVLYREDIVKKYSYDNDMLWQLDNETESSLIAEAKSFDTLDEFIAFEKAFDLDEMSNEELTEIWDKAHFVYNAKQEYVSPIDPNLSDNDKDEAFRVIMSSDEGITSFIERLREAFSIRHDVRRDGGDVGASSIEEYNDFIQQMANADRVEREAAPYIVALAKSRKEISKDAIAKVRGMINNSLRDYRDLYSQVIGDENFAAGVYSEYMPDIKDSRANGMRITERKDLASRLEGEEIREAVRRGTEKYDGTAEKVMAVYDKELKDLQEKYDKLSEDHKRNYLKLSREEADNYNKQVKIKKMESAIKKERQSVRQKLDEDRRVPTEQIQKLKTWEDEVALLHEEIKQLRKQDSVKATLEKREALDNLKKQIKEKQQAKAAAEAVHRYKRELYNSIVEKVPNNVDYSYNQKIQEIVATIKGVQGYQNDSITVNGKKMSLTDFRKAVEDGTIKVEGLSDYQLKRYLNTSLADLTISDLETLRDTVEYYKKQGKQMWQAKVDQRAYEAQHLRDQLVSEVYKSKSYDPEKDYLSNTAESDKVKKKGKLKGVFYKTLNWNRKAQILDNNTKGLNYDLTVEERRVHQDEQLRGVRDRVNPVKDILEENKLKENDFYNTVPIVFPDGRTETFTVGKLAYAMLAEKNERNYNAVAYGNLVTQLEKQNMNGSTNAVNQQIKKLGDSRYQALKAQAEEYFSQHPEYMKVINAIVDDWNNEEKLAQIQEVLIDEYNKPMDVEGFYMTMHRQDFNGEESAYRLRDDMYNLNAGKNTTTPDKGFSQSRIDMSPLNQQPVDMDIYRVWLQSVEDQENVIANLAYVRKLNRVYKGYGSRGLRSAIENAYGNAIVTDLDNYINEIANSSLFADTQEINGVISKLRGGLYTSYLGYKMSGIVLQGITSPMPSLQEVSPIQLAKGLLQMTFHPVSTWKTICELSPYMEHRSMNPAIDAIRKYAAQYTDSKMKTAYRQFLEFGTSGLEAIDRWAVSGSWLAVYEKKLAELGDSKAAAHYADNFIRDTQPSGDVTEIAPLFKSKSAFAQAFTQFQVSLNVIWNNVVYDMPNAVKKHEYSKAVGIVFGYALAGALLNLAQGGYDDDDEPEDIAKKLIYSTTTQFTQSTPLMGSLVDALAQSAITGESGWIYSTNQLYPGISNIASGLNTMLSTDSDGNRKGLTTSAIKNITKGIALMTGLPTSGADELWQTFFDKDLIDAINDGDLNFRFNPGALLGQRDY